MTIFIVIYDALGVSLCIFFLLHIECISDVVFVPLDFRLLASVL